MSKILAVDFDGTLCDDKFPRIGAERPEVIEWVKKQYRYGHKLVLWTCREGQSLMEAYDWCCARGILFTAVNENVPELKFCEYGHHKIVADIYIDDKAGNISDLLQLQDIDNFVKG